MKRVGTVFFKAGADSYYTPAYLRPDLEAVVTIEVTHRFGSPTLEFSVETKNLDGTWAVAASFDDITTTGVSTKTITDLQEMYRYCFALSTGTSNGDGFCLNAPEAIAVPE